MNIADLIPEYRSEINNGLADIYPPSENIFNAFNKFNVNETKVIIIGQDPYHGPSQAHGLCFSVQPTVAIPPSLRNIYLELENDLDILISQASIPK